jgi:predicted nucleic acid-binding protein
MNVVVSDSGPIRYLVLCDAIDVLPQLYGKLSIPRAVANELSQADTPESVRAWIQSLPVWAALCDPKKLDPALELGQGERAAIALAVEIKSRQLLVDDRVARRIAIQRGLSITGTVGILELAAERGLLNLRDVFGKLLATNFRIDREVVRDALARDDARRHPGK